MSRRVSYTITAVVMTLLAAFWFMSGWVRTHGSPPDQIEWVWPMPMPQWFWATSAIAVVVCAVLCLRSGRHALLSGHRPECGYDLTAIVSGRCPECGSETPRWSPSEGPECRPPRAGPQAGVQNVDHPQIRPEENDER
jgi:hypothetical protein